MEGWESDLVYTGEHDRIPDIVERTDVHEEFNEIIIWQLSFGHIPDGYPFNVEGSAALIRGEY